MTPRNPRDRIPEGSSGRRSKATAGTPPAGAQPYLRALASALGRGQTETGHPPPGALRSLLQGADESLKAVAPVPEPRAARGLRVGEPPPAPLVPRVERPGLTPTRQALDRLSGAARSPGLAALEDLYPSPMALAEDVFLARCLLRDAPAVLELAAMRDFLARAVVPERLPELAMDRTVGLEQVSFATLWAEPTA